MKLEAIHFLSILTSAKPLAILDKDIDATLFDEKFQVERSIALSHSRIMQNCLPLTVPLGKIHLMRLASFAMRPQYLYGIELSILDREVNSRLSSVLIFDIWVGLVSK